MNGTLRDFVKTECRNERARKDDNDLENQISEGFIEGNDQSPQENKEMIVKISDNEDIEPNEEDFLLNLLMISRFLVPTIC